MTQDITNRKDIEALVDAFYREVRVDTEIGPFFNETISDWPDHLNRLSDFWESNLLMVQAYKGNPMRAHIAVDHQFSNSIQQIHFERWLELWTHTVDTLFQGRNAQLAKDRARNIANIMFIRIFQARGISN